MRHSKTKLKRNLAIPGEPMPKEEFIALIKEAEKGPFHELGSFDDFKNRILSEWRKEHGK
jgi:hypothetical protein